MKGGAAWKNTHIELPDNFVDSGFGINAAFKVDVVTFFNAVRIQGGAQTQANSRQIWKLENIQRTASAGSKVESFPDENA